MLSNIFTQIHNFLSTSHFPFLIQQPKSKISASRKLSLKVGLPTLLYTLFLTRTLLLKLLSSSFFNQIMLLNRAMDDLEKEKQDREEEKNRYPRRKTPYFAAFWTLSGRVTGDTLSQKEHFNWRQNVQFSFIYYLSNLRLVVFMLHIHFQNLCSNSMPKSML